MSSSFRAHVVAALTCLCTPSFASNVPFDNILLENVRGYRIDAEAGRQTFSTLLIENGKVRAYDETAQTLAATIDVERINGAGKTVLPGLIDSHGHVQGLGQEKRQVDLRGSLSLAEALQRIKRFAAQQTADARNHRNLRDQWLLGRGWNQVLWPGKQFPTAADLDALFAERPVLLERIDGHASWANSLAMKHAGISKTTPDPDGGQILRDRDGNPTGIFVDNAMSLLHAHVPAADAEERRVQLRDALQELASLGMTGVHDAGISPSDYQLYQQLGHSNELPIRVYAMLADSVEARLLLQAPPPAPLFENRLYLQAVKAWADGALGSRGAALLADYSDHPHHRGLLLYSPSQLLELTKLGVSNGWQMNIHAIGDAGNRLVLDTLATAARDGKARALRHRIEHAQVIALSDIPRFNAQQVIASIQPTHATSDMNMAEARVGAERIKGAYAWRKLLDAGVRLTGGSDFPVELANPFYGLHAAVTRTDRNGQPTGGWYPAEKLSRDEALRLFTLDAAYAGNMETITGSLAIGQYADFIVIDRDYFTVTEPEIAAIKVLSTWVAGRKIYTADN